MLLNGLLIKIKKIEKEIKMNSYDIQVELGINSSKFEYVYDENEGRRVITQVKNYPNVSSRRYL